MLAKRGERLSERMRARSIKVRGASPSFSFSYDHNAPGSAVFFVLTRLFQCLEASLSLRFCLRVKNFCGILLRCCFHYCCKNQANSQPQILSFENLLLLRQILTMRARRGECGKMLMEKLTAQFMLVCSVPLLISIK